MSCMMYVCVCMQPSGPRSALRSQPPRPPFVAAVAVAAALRIVRVAVANGAQDTGYTRKAAWG